MTQQEILDLVQLDKNDEATLRRIKSALLQINENTNTNIAENVTYEELYNKIINSNLVPGKKYRLTNYRSVNYLHGNTTANSFNFF